MTPEELAGLVLAVRRAAIALATIAAVLFVYTIWQSYAGRVALRDSQVAGCERAKSDRHVNALGWRTAEAARRASGTADDLVAANRYDNIAGSLEARASIDCNTAFPHPTLLHR